MTAALPTFQLRKPSAGVIAAGLFAAAWLGLYLPLYIEFAGGPWTREENSHAPFIMSICLGTAWARLNQGGFNPAPQRDFYFGVLILGVGLALYGLGRVGDIVLLSSASQSVTALGGCIALLGVAGARRLWFPLLLSLYLIIWPGWALDIATAPLKLFVSEAVSSSLFYFGLPVAHSGAIIAAGNYELLVADACAGLNSLIALTAVGAVYLYIARRRSLTVNFIVAASLVPIAIFANLIRVAILTLLTYYAGYDAGQSFLHETAGLVTFAIALLSVFLVDAAAALIWERRR